MSHFKHSIISEECSRKEVAQRVPHTSAAMAKLRLIWKGNVSLKIEIRLLLHTLVFSIISYACESWTLTTELQRRIQAAEMSYHRRILGISYLAHVTNETSQHRQRLF